MSEQASVGSIANGRHRTAIRRVRCSRPVSLALAEGVINNGTSVFDYGCGHGGDVRYLASQGIKATGWDPHYAPNEEIVEADVVNLGFVLNVIEDPRERTETLQRAFGLARAALVVSVRVDDALEKATEWGDGVLTAKGTFQKIFTHGEFRAYVESSLSRRVHTGELGVGYVFSTSEAEQRYIASKAFTRRLEYRTDLVAKFEADQVAMSYVDLANALGRAPAPEEFSGFEQLRATFGSDERIQRLLLSRIDRDAYAGSRAERRNDMLVYLALLRLQGITPPPYRALPGTVQADVKAIWGSYERAKSDGKEFLFSLGQPEAIRMACAASTVGKLLPTDLYVHRSAEDDLPALLRVVLGAAKRVIGELSYDVAKIAIDGRAVSFLEYPDFDETAHPALTRSVRVYLPKASYGVRDYSTSSNPPILHRKDELVTEQYHRFAEFRALTEQEEQIGLLSKGDIGFRTGWDALLSAYKLEVIGHQVKPIPERSPPD